MKVLDFGIAKAAPDMMETGAIGLTRENILQGTPAYIAPEQALQRLAAWTIAPTSTPRDASRYFLLTGKPVFTGETPMVVVVHHARTAAERAVGAASELPIPPALDRLVLDCLAKRPRRPAAVSTGAVAETCGDRRAEGMD